MSRSMHAHQAPDRKRHFVSSYRHGCKVKSISHEDHGEAISSYEKPLCPMSKARSLVSGDPSAGSRVAHPHPACPPLLFPVKSTLPAHRRSPPSFKPSSPTNSCSPPTDHPPPQVGIMLTGFKIDKMVLGGPAHNSGQLQHGDVIMQVDPPPRATLPSLLLLPTAVCCCYSPPLPPPLPPPPPPTPQQQ